MSGEAEKTVEIEEATSQDEVIDVHSLGPKDLENHVKGFDSAGDDKPIPDDKSGSDDEAEEEEDAIPDDSAAETDDSTPDSEDDEDDPDEDEDGDQPTGNRFKDNQRAFHKERDKNKALLKEIQDLKKENLSLKAPSEPKKYTDAELQDLRDSNPDAYIDAVKAQEKYEQEKESHDDDVQKYEELEEQARLQIAQDNTLDAFARATETLLGLPADTIDPLNPSDDVSTFMTSTEFQKTVAELDKNASKYVESDGSFSARTIRMLHRDLNFDSLTASQRKKGAENAVDSISKATGRGSKHDRVPRDSSADKGRKGFGNLTQAEINGMGPAALKQLKDEARAAGHFD